MSIWKDDYRAGLCMIKEFDVDKVPGHWEEVVAKLGNPHV